MRISDWSSDVCSSDLAGNNAAGTLHRKANHRPYDPQNAVRKSRASSVQRTAWRPAGGVSHTRSFASPDAPGKGVVPGTECTPKAPEGAWNLGDFKDLRGKKGVGRCGTDNQDRKSKLLNSSH